MQAINRTSPKESVLLIGNYRPTVVLAKMFSRREYRVIAGLEGCDQGAERSRFVEEVWDHPPINQREDFTAALAGFIAGRQDLTVLYPVSEEAVRFFIETKPDLPPHIQLAMCEPSLVNTCLDKVAMYSLARQLGVATAPFALVETLDGLQSCLDQTGLPAVVRPADSTKRLGGKKAVTLNSMDDLSMLFPAWPSEQKALVVQRKVSGLRHNVYFAAQNGRIVRYLHAVIERTDRPDGSGLALEGVTVKPDPALKQDVETLLAALNYNGVGCAQFLVDQTSGKTSFLEINPRIAGNHAVPECAGLDLGELQVQLTSGQETGVSYREGRPGLRYCWLTGELYTIKLELLARKITAGQALRRCLTALRTFWKSDLDMVLDRTDPRPGLMALLKLLPRPSGSLAWFRQSLPTITATPRENET